MLQQEVQDRSVISINGMHKQTPASFRVQAKFKKSVEDGYVRLRVGYCECETSEDIRYPLQDMMDDIGVLRARKKV